MGPHDQTQIGLVLVTWDSRALCSYLLTPQKWAYWNIWSCWIPQRYLYMCVFTGICVYWIQQRRTWVTFLGVSPFTNVVSTYKPWSSHVVRKEEACGWELGVVPDLLAIGEAALAWKTRDRASVDWGGTWTLGFEFKSPDLLNLSCVSLENSLDLSESWFPYMRWTSLTSDDYTDLGIKDGSDSRSQVVLMVKNLPANSRDIRMSGSIPGLERFHLQGAAKPVCHSYWTRALELMLLSKRSHCSEKPIH